VESLARQVERLGAARTTSERRRADTQFNIEVAAAAQSPRLTQEELRLRAEVGDLLWLQLDDADHEESVTARRELVAAIRERRPVDARDHAERHVATDTRRLLQLRLQVYEIRPAVVPGQGGRGRR
jgi:DNA-binding FadR family transcriptional regulator